jgi:cell division protein FtsI/penicillin-binding protein 2
MVEKIIDSNEELVIPPRFVRQVISPQTAEVITEMMVASVATGDAMWALPEGYRIAGKTGTAQVSVGGSITKRRQLARLSDLRLQMTPDL